MHQYLLFEFTGYNFAIPTAVNCYNYGQLHFNFQINRENY